MQRSGSKTDLLLACQWPFGQDDVVSTGGPEADYGSAFHELIAALPLSGKEPPRAMVNTKAARLIEKWKLKDFPELGGVEPEELTTHVLEARQAFADWWLKEAGSFKGWAVLREQALAYNPWDDYGRTIDGASQEGHIYEGVEPDELPMTLDVSLKKGRDLWVLDYKTGEDPGMPNQSGQLASLGLALAAFYGPKGRRVREPEDNPLRVHVGIIHAPRRSSTTIQACRLNFKRMDQHQRDLRRAMSRIGDGSLRPGGHCTSLYCPALRTCPSKTSALVALKADGALTEERVGKIHQTMQLYDRMRDALRAELRAWVREHGPGLREDGQLVVLRKKSRRSLSISSIEEALGKGKEFDDVINALDRGGCIKTVEYEELVAEPDRGR